MRRWSVIDAGLQHNMGSCRREKKRTGEKMRERCVLENAAGTSVL
jgi:hypothetical protein